MRPGALDGVLVADFSRVLAGPLCTMTLADLGAEVVKVERPGSGDDTRSWGPSYFTGLNRGKRSVTLDLKDPDDLELARELARRADVLVESFRPGLMDRLGLGYAAVAADNPWVVWCSISAFGSEGEAAELPGYDLLLQAMGGLMSVTGEPGGRPLKVGAALIDMVCGLHAAVGILAALRARESTGHGQRLEVTLMDSALAALLNQASTHLVEGRVPGRMGNGHPSIAPYETFRAGGGTELAIAVGNDGQFARLCNVLGLPGLPADPRFATNPARVEHRAALGEALEVALAARPAAEWVALLRPAAVPAGPIHDVGQAFAFAEALGLDPVDETGGVRTVRSPLRTPVRRPPPGLGEHDAEVRAWLSEPEGS